MEHHFNVELARYYGVNEAIFCHNLYFWVKQNKANKRNLHKGTYWTYNTMDAYVELFPYWSKRQIEHLIQKCKDKGLILTDNFNKNSYDRTLWYAVTEKVISAYEPLNGAFHKNGKWETTHFTKMGNGNHKNVSPIPDSKPDNKQNTNKQYISNIDDDKRTSHSEKEINLIISNFRESTKDVLTDRSFNAVVRKVVDKYNQGKVNSFRDYLVTSLVAKIEELELRRNKDKAKPQNAQNRANTKQQELHNMELKELPFYDWLNS